MSSTASPLPEALLAGDLQKHIEQIRNQCTDCGACIHHCAFLQEHGSPLKIINQLAFNDAAQCQISFACSLCGLCTTLCPQKLDPCGFFLDLRRHRTALAPLNLSPYKSLLFYERLGASQLFSLFKLPQGCTTIFFPGCSLPGTRPAVTLRLLAHLQSPKNTLGLVLTCCTKPSHDLGRNDVFSTNFQAIRERLRSHGITNVLTACPNCTAVFRRYAPELTTQNVFTVLAEQGFSLSHEQPVHQEVVIHDPCPLRADKYSQQATRTLVAQRGYTITPMRHEQKRTICCGEGGAVGALHPELASTWTHKRIVQAQGRTIITTCGGCSGTFARFTDVLHLADLLFGRYVDGKPQPKISPPPMTYLNRLWLKLRYNWLFWRRKKRSER
nr:(Fe-S)-binding protein [uncultured Desulfobulbus sp.]